MGQAAVRPVRETVIRRALAWALALMANGALIASIVLVPRSAPAPAPSTIVDLVLIAALPPEPEPEPLVSPPETAAAPTPQQIEPARLQSSDAPADAATVRTSADDDEDEIEDEIEVRPDDLAANRLPDGAVFILPPPAAAGTTAGFIREIFCMTSSEASREAGGCADDPHGEGLSLLRYATGAANDEALQAALGLGLSAAEIRALFAGDGLPLADLTGEPALADASQRPTSSADQMRDSLPPRHPDPAFGD